MPGNVIDLAARRRKALVSSLPVLPPPPARTHGRIAVAMEATRGRVRVVFGDGSGGGAEAWFTPEQADHVAKELTRFGRVARGLSPDGDSQ